MSDSTTTVLDRKRPWLTDERELPANMNWLQTLFNPTGTSPRLHFTRAWTLLFMLQLLVITHCCWLRRHEHKLELLIRPRLLLGRLAFWK